MKEGWQFMAPQVVLEPATLEAMLQPALPGARLRGFRRAGGGLANLTYRVEVEGRKDPLFLKIYVREPRAARLEAALALRLDGLLPVPRFLALEASNPATGHPYAVTTWLEGETLGATLRADPGSGEALGRAVGASLAALGRVTFPEPGLLDAALQVAQPLPRGRDGFLEVLGWLETDLVFQRLGPALAADYRALVEREAPRLEALVVETPCLVHADFDTGNLLVQRTEAGWRVSGVLDWEFAHSGSPLEDLGHLLRPPAGGHPGFEPGLVQGFTEGGGHLPSGWRAMARLLDLTAFVDFLARPEAGPEVVCSARRAIQDTIRDLDT